MAGIYIHIPFCSNKCYYCDFYSIASKKNKSLFIDTLLTEIDQRSNYLNNDLIETIYFGGGTPSILNIDELKKIINKLNSVSDLSQVKEFTFESNPEDITPKYINDLKSINVNRLSIGIQSFFDDDLKLMNRVHSSTQAKQAINNAIENGITNISIDLIYGLPNSNILKWKENIKTALKFDVNHISAYHLTYEPRTVFYKYLEQKKISKISEELSIEQYNLLTTTLAENNFKHYEISNFAKNNKFSLHNLNYWDNIKYVGFGPSAHSFDLKSRQWNISNLNQYIKLISENKIYFEKEILTKKDKFNDFIITHLRTKNGINKTELKSNFSKKYIDYFFDKLKLYGTSDNLINKPEKVYLSEKGFLISDKIFEDFIYI